MRLDDLHRLRDAGLIPAGRFLQAAARLRDGPRWEAWGRRALLAAGMAHLLAGVIFFFAFNWADLSAMAKFALLAGPNDCPSSNVKAARPLIAPGESRTLLPVPHGLRTFPRPL